MIVAAAKIVLDFWGNDDLRKKRKLIDTLAEQLHSAHKVYITEVEEFDDLERCVLGLSYCSRDTTSARDRMKKVLDFIDKNSAARVFAEDSDFQEFAGSYPSP